MVSALARASSPVIAEAAARACGRGGRRRRGLGVKGGGGGEGGGGEGLEGGGGLVGGGYGAIGCC